MRGMIGICLANLLFGSYGRISDVEGDVWIVRNGEKIPVTVNLIVEPGEALLVRDGEVEVEFNYGSVVWLGDESKLAIHRILEEKRLFEFHYGKAVFYNKSISPLIVLIPQGEITLKEESRVKMDLEPGGDLYVKVVEGEIYFDSEEERIVITEGQSVKIDKWGRVVQRKKKWDDDFYYWCEKRYKTRYVLIEKVTYLPSFIWVGIVDLKFYGKWIYLPPYGWVWVPKVWVGWFPYFYGYWRWSPLYGWVWISYEPWGWVPYRYGRWVFIIGTGWVWVPGSEFSGCWVSWYRFEDGAIGWSPLDNQNRAVVYNGETLILKSTQEHFLNPIPQKMQIKELSDVSKFKSNFEIVSSKFSPNFQKVDKPYYEKREKPLSKEAQKIKPKTYREKSVKGIEQPVIEGAENVRIERIRKKVQKDKALRELSAEEKTIKILRIQRIKDPFGKSEKREKISSSGNKGDFKPYSPLTPQREDNIKVDEKAK